MDGERHLLGDFHGGNVLAAGTAARGMTLVELSIGLVIVGLLMFMGLPSFSAWLQGSQIRNAAEAIQNGLQLARAEAVRRNTTVRFQLTDTMTNACAASASGGNWVVSLDDPSGACAAAASEAVAPRIIQARPAAEGSLNAVVAADQSAIVFSGAGRVTPVPAAAININVTNPTGGTCVASGGTMRCLRVVVSTAGQVRMCDPALASTDPRGC